VSGIKLVAPLAAHRLDERKVFDYLAAHVEGIFPSDAALLQFQGGQSNPTYLIESGGRRFVLRKKPPGKLLPSAHQIDREFRIQQALQGSAVPVPDMLHYCTDISVCGTEFYVMAYLEGRVFSDAFMPELSRGERRAVQAQLFEVIGRLHAIDYRALGLADFGRAGQYVQRQMVRWRTQYEASRTETLVDMDRLIDWLGRNMPESDETAIAHGDFRLGNMMVAADAPRIVAVLDWELATLGHPLADLAYCCMPFHLPQTAGLAMRGYGDADLAAYGLRGEAEVLELYCKATGRPEIPAADWKFFIGFALFRSAAIVEGVYARALAGNAADARAHEMHELAKVTCAAGWRVVSAGG
jgi:aminoglycoside phosphotransferase (APT) family kinase protein